MKKVVIASIILSIKNVKKEEKKEKKKKGPGVVQVKFFGVIGTFDIQTMKTTYKIEYFFVLDYILIVSP